MTTTENHPRLVRLLQDYRAAPEAFHATSYWAAYEGRLLEEVSSLDFSQLRSGKARILETFGFNDLTYKYQSKQFFLERWLLKALTRTFGNIREILPYGIRLKDIREMAVHHCQIAGQLADARPIEELSASEFGKPADLFEYAGQKYTMPFLNNYVRYCFAKQHIPLTGRDVYVELGTGSGYQVEVLKKSHPDMTFLCFDLPAQLFLCEEYLRNVFGDDAVVSADETSAWSSLAGVQPGKIHFFGNWKWPLLKGYEFDLFWNAASFGEMEPEVVRNYLSCIKDSVDYVYLLQARHGKQTSGTGSVVQKATKFPDYEAMLDGFRLLAEQDAWHAHKKMSGSGGYFQACWKTARPGHPA